MDRAAIAIVSTLTLMHLLACGRADRATQDTASAVGDADSTVAVTDADTDVAADTDVSAISDAVAACGATSPAELAACVEPGRYVASLTFVAAKRAPSSAHWQAVQDRCASVFAAAGFAVERHTYATGVNVIGVKAGTRKADERVVVSAHYDHVSGCDGADDNASGVAGVLELARALGPATFERTVVLACWDEEERGLLGASAYAARAKARGEQIVVAFSLEMIGYVDDAPNSQQLPNGLDLLFPAEAAWLAARDARGDFIALVGDPGAVDVTARFAAHAEGLALPTLVLDVPAALIESPLLGDIFRSDHAAFWGEGYPGIMVTDTANFRNPNYHCAGGPDTVATLDTDFAARVVRAVAATTAETAGMP